jgi:hypothetical protein
MSGGAGLKRQMRMFGRPSAANLASTDMDQWRNWAIIGTVSAWVTSISHLLRTMPR